MPRHTIMWNSLVFTWKLRSDSGEHWKGAPPFVSRQFFPNNPCAVSALRVWSGFYSMVKDRMISDAYYGWSKIPLFLEAIPADVSGNHHLKYLFKLLSASFPPKPLTFWFRITHMCGQVSLGRLPFSKCPTTCGLSIIIVWDDSGELSESLSSEDLPI